MIVAGAAGVHWEDQLASEKKCGHLGGKVLVPTRQHVRTLNSARLAADLSGVPTVIIARTDALGASLITSDVDPVDAPFCTGERTGEGFYRVRNGIEPVLARAKAYAPYADLIWVETGTPDLGLAREFAIELHREYPGKMLAYNCSPSFNWKAALDDRQIAEFQDRLGALGYRFQFITLAGFHALNHSMFSLAKGYARDGMTPTSPCSRPSSPTKRTATPPLDTKRKWARATSTRWPPPSIRAARPPLWPAPPKLSSSTEQESTIMTILEDRQQISVPIGRPSTTLEVLGARHPGFGKILTPAALDFVAKLQRRFGAGRRELLTRRSATARPAVPKFGPDTAAVRADRSWQVAPPAPGLADRRCEITGPPTRKMTIGAMNSGARVWMADFEDATSPTWFNIIDGQRNLYDAIRRQIDYTDETGRRHELAEQTATIMVRPRGWHLVEHHLRLHGEPIAGALVDFGLYFFHNAETLIKNGHGPYFYLPKLESQHRGAAVARRVRVVGVPTRPGARNDPSHLPDRDLPGRVPNDGDPLRAT